MNENWIEVARLAKNEGFSWDEIARVLKVNANIVRNRVGSKKRPAMSLEDWQLYKDYLAGIPQIAEVSAITNNILEYITEEELITYQTKWQIGKDKKTYYKRIQEIGLKIPMDKFPEYKEPLDSAQKYLEHKTAEFYDE